MKYLILVAGLFLTACGSNKSERFVEIEVKKNDLVYGNFCLVKEDSSTTEGFRCIKEKKLDSSMYYLGMSSAYQNVVNFSSNRITK